MKRTIKNLTIGLGLSVALLTSGCLTPGPNPPKPPTPEQIDAAALVLRNVTRASLVLVINKNGDKARNYVGLAKDTLSLFIAGTDHSAEALASRLASIPLNGLNQSEASIIILTVISTYDIFLGEYVRNEVSRREIALKALTAIRDGCAEALTLTHPPVN